jgi:hypothetical protein
MPLKFWDEAFLTIVFLINHLPTPILAHSTPIEKLFNTKPAYSFLRTFGCTCWPNLRPYNTYKLAFRSKQCAFLGYSTHHKGYKCLDIATGHVYIFRNVIFNENVFPFASLHANAGARLHSEISLLPSGGGPVMASYGLRHTWSDQKIILQSYCSLLFLLCRPYLVFPASSTTAPSHDPP